MEWLSENDNQTFVLALVILAMFGGTGIIWTFHAPQLPGDVAGGVIGALTMLTGAIGNHFFKFLNKEQPGPDGTNSGNLNGHNGNGTSHILPPAPPSAGG